jgi:ATP-dependent RNA helicase RhlE
VLAQILKQEQVNRALIFTRTKHGADKVVKGLAKVGIRADAIHGNKSQNNRERALAAFRSGEIRSLVATDIAARGIDVDGISHVVNFDLPNVPETYVHRIGRTARAGAEGVAISLIAGAEEIGYLRDIERLIKITLPREDRRTPGTRDAAAPAPAQRPAHNRGGRSGPRGHSARGQESRGHESRGHESRGHESRGHESRGHDAAPGSKGPRRPRRGGGNNAAPQAPRHESPRPAQGGNSEGIQGVAFLHRESRPNTQPNRTHRPQR